MRVRCLRCHRIASLRYPCQICGSTKHIFRYLAYVFADLWGYNQTTMSPNSVGDEINITPSPVQTAWETNEYVFFIENKTMLRR